MDLFGEEPKVETEDAEAFSGLAEPEENLPTLKHPRQMAFCLGHDDVEKHLFELVESGRMPHGLIFAGQKGIGKATMAYRLARYLLKERPDENQGGMFADDAPLPADFGMAPDEPTFRRVASGGHPEFMNIERAYDSSTNKYKDNVPVDEIRKVPGFLRMTSSNGGWRVVIIDDADTMNRNAQNALLKVLEEPPKKTVLILVTHRLGALIPTIRSRTQLIHFQPLKEHNLASLLQEQNYGLHAEDLKTLAQLSEGSIGKAVEYVEHNALETLSEILELLSKHPKWDWPSIHAIADNLAGRGQDQNYKTFTDLFKWLFARLCVIKARNINADQLILNSEAIKGLVTNSSLEQLLEICENLHKHFDKVKYANLDKRQGVLGAFSLISA